MTIPRSLAISRIRLHWPDADEIRFAGKCHVCKHKDTMYSYQLPGDGPRGMGEETCGYFCVNPSCGWSNGGSRPSIDTEEET